MVEERCDLSALDQVNGFQSDCFLYFAYQAEKETLARRMREMLHQCYKFGFEVLNPNVYNQCLLFVPQYHKELDKLITGESSKRVLAQGVIQFSMQWMR